MRRKIALILGAGAARITSAFRLVTESDIKPIIIESENIIGGLARTLDFDGLKADIDPHRFLQRIKL